MRKSKCKNRIKKKHCEHCERLVLLSELKYGLCEDCYEEYIDLQQIIYSNES